MSLYIHFVISLALVFYIGYELFKIISSKKDKASLVATVIGGFTIIFGLYLWLKNGLRLDYGTDDYIIQTNAKLLFYLGIGNIIVGTIFWVFLYIKIFIDIAKKPLHNHT